MMLLLRISIVCTCNNVHVLLAKFEKNDKVEVEKWTWFVYNWFINSEVSFEADALIGGKIRKINETYLEGEV